MSPYREAEKILEDLSKRPEARHWWSETPTHIRRAMADGIARVIENCMDQAEGKHE